MRSSFESMSCLRMFCGNENCDVVHIYLTLEILARPLRYRVITLRFNTDTPILLLSCLILKAASDVDLAT